MRQRKRPLRLDRANVVGIVQSTRGFTLACGARGRGADAFEVRLDALPRMPESTRLCQLPAPVIATVRHQTEGGGGDRTDDQRVECYLAALPHVAAVDIELATVRAMKPVVDAARKCGVKVILSLHDFSAMPARLPAAQSRAMQAGADVFKVAATPSTPAELGRLLALLDAPPLPTAVMGMGPLGKASRVAAMACGSVLNYGWLERPNVSGQWSAMDLLRLRQ